MTEPFLFDPAGRLAVGGPRDAHEQQLIVQGATSILWHRRDARFAGVYVDNETGGSPAGTPDQLHERDAIARRMLSAVGVRDLVVVGLYPSEPHHRIPGCLCALEWYPYHDMGWPLTPPRCEAYIIQWRFAWRPPLVEKPDRPPSRAERLALYARVRLRRPKLILAY